MGNNIFRGDDLQLASCGQWNRTLPDDFALSGVRTDTREDCSGALFLALRGENFDAHDFLDHALAAGAAALCIETASAVRIKPAWKIPVLLVEDTLTAYQAIANFHRRRFPELRAVAVTGSMGKTSCKEIIKSILAAAAGADAVCATENNTNNQVGVPRNLFNLNSGHRFCVLEMGSNHFGEIAPLSRILEPEVALINSIAPCHLEAFGDLRGVAREKSAVFAGLKPGGIAVIPAAGPESDYLLKQTENFRVLRFGADVRAVYHGGSIGGSRIELVFADPDKRIAVEWPLTGAHQAANAAAAAAVARGLGIEIGAIAAGLRNCVLPGMRMKVARIGGIDWINDAYNASPGSMAAALHWLKEFVQPQNLVLVLGDMLELGAASFQLHQQILGQAFGLFPDAVFVLTGPEYERAGVDLALPSGCRFCKNSEAARTVLQPFLRPGQTVFLKGSRGMKLEKVWPDEDA
ncbi:MAG: UDP-N-acetylmuramoyl-tripeptide--D-alanyl-D-alanine ligase [Victivallaceae bacterium]|nr:UDP-N-acetylmuramoyl-tripeptide--D-alanyl-D-alanine ligase [Victivallaceae bacterium]